MVAIKFIAQMVQVVNHWIYKALCSGRSFLIQQLISNLKLLANLHVAYSNIQDIVRVIDGIERNINRLH